MNQVRNIMWLLIVGALGQSACNPALSPADYYKWNNSINNPLKKMQKLKHYNISVTYCPVNYMALSQLNGEKVNRPALESSKKGFYCCRHFKITFSAKDTSDVLKYKLREPEEYFARIKYLSNDISNHLFLIEGKDTLPCTFVHYERTYKMKASATVMAFFERKVNGADEQTPMKLVLTRGGFNPEKLEFSITKEDLSKIPGLSI